MFIIYCVKLAMRIAVFIAAILIYFKDKNSLILANEGFFSFFNNGIKPLQIFWLILAIEMIQKFFPLKIISMGCRKQFKANYKPSALKPPPPVINALIKEENDAAQKVFLIWFGGNTATAILYYTGALGASELLLLTLFYFCCDLICVLWYCPFQSLIMKNRCCVTCRIFNWDSIMICTPLFFIPGFFSWSLVSIALILLVWWELTYRRQPLRFLEGGNENLQCKNCEDKICKLKQPMKMRRLHSRTNKEC